MTSDQVEQDVRQVVQQIIRHGDGIAGGALNVDWFAVDEALKHDPSARQVESSFRPVWADTRHIIASRPGECHTRAGVTTH